MIDDDDYDTVQEDDHYVLHNNDGDIRLKYAEP
jgi:hypothetical protein